MEKRFLRFPTVKRTALYAETYVSRRETQYFNKMRKDNVTMLKIK